MTLLQKTDIYQGAKEKADTGYGFLLALICVALALAVASVMFGAIPSELPVVGP